MMAELTSEAEELSDALKEKVLLSILKNQFRQDVATELETPEGTEESNRREAPNGQNESGDHENILSGMQCTDCPENQEPTVPENQKTGTPERNSGSDLDTVEQNKTTKILEDQVLTALGDQSQTDSPEQRTTARETQETTGSDDQETAGSEDQAPQAPENDVAKPDLIKENEEKLAAEESALSQDQLKERHEKSQSLRAQANNLYKESAFNDAAIKYSEALQICPLSEEKARSILHANRAAALMAGHQNREALPDLDRALELDPNYLKALERRARLHKLLENLDDSLKDYQRLLELKPKHYAYIATVRELQEQIKKRDEELKAKMLDSLKQLGNVFLKPFGLSTENFSMVPNDGGGYSLQMKGQQ